MNRRSFLKSISLLPLMNGFEWANHKEQGNIQFSYSEYDRSYYKNYGKFTLRHRPCHYPCKSVATPILTTWDEVWKRHKYMIISGLYSQLFIKDDPFVVCPDCWSGQYMGTQCKRCGHLWQSHPNEAPLLCPTCGYIQRVFVNGKYIAPDQIGQKLGQYWWCSECQELTVNIPGMTAERLSHNAFFEKYPNGMNIGHCGLNTSVTRKNIAEIFPKCANCECDDKFHAAFWLPLNKAKNIEYN